LLIEKKIGKDFKDFIFPGEHIEDKEPINDSSIRKIQEEKGLLVSKLKLCGATD
jgi:hypothetical protein